THATCLPLDEKLHLNNKLGFVGNQMPFSAHVKMVLQLGGTREEIEELFLFMCVYAGFNKAVACFGRLNDILGPPS
ncbi:MAG: carboxymuconolactone decarboxylase family protein, partial [Candidatus Competibacteraceae bacterium]|nr:carboxymuconolactone decarboxylase family protein [Candidatus Competibacteraceae bacterium]